MKEKTSSDAEGGMWMSPDRQIEILMRATRFADESDDWVKNSDSGQTLRAQMMRELKEKLMLNRPLRVYLGVDPTGTNLHVGHFVPLQKLKRFQELGHQVVFLIGDYTAMIGDPSGQSSERKRLSHDDVMNMAETYTEQAFRILDPEKTEVRYNGEWLSKLSFSDIIELASIFPMKQIISRRDFQDRMAKGESLRFHEALYSLMQGYDAYMLKCDVQVGAYDQHFNMLAGRVIQQHFGEKPHIMITNPLIIGTDGRKMSKSYNNTINVYDNPFDMYGKAMRIADEYIRDYLELSSSLDGHTIDLLLDELKTGDNPMGVKKKLAFDLVSQYHNMVDAKEAEKKFQQIVQQKEAPEEIPQMAVPSALIGKPWIDLLSSLSLCGSKSEARRLIEQGGFYIDQLQMKDIHMASSVSDEGILIRLGKRRYYRLVLQR